MRCSNTTVLSFKNHSLNSFSPITSYNNYTSFTISYFLLAIMSCQFVISTHVHQCKWVSYSESPFYHRVHRSTTSPRPSGAMRLAATRAEVGRRVSSLAKAPGFWSAQLPSFGVRDVIWCHQHEASFIYNYLSISMYYIVILWYINMSTHVCKYIDSNFSEKWKTRGDRFWQIEPGEIENPARAPNQRQPARKEPLGPEIAAEEVRNWGSIQQAKTGNI